MPYLYTKRKPKVAFSIFHFVLLYFFPVMNALINIDIELTVGKETLGFHNYKIWQILKRFTGTFCRAQTLKLGGVNV